MDSISNAPKHKMEIELIKNDDAHIDHFKLSFNNTTLGRFFWQLNINKDSAEVLVNSYHSIYEYDDHNDIVMWYHFDIGVIRFTSKVNQFTWYFISKN